MTPSAENDMHARDLLALLFGEWLAGADGTADVAPAEQGLYTVRAGEETVALAIEPLGSGPEEWQAELQAFAARLTPPGSAALVWLPPGATPPRDEPAQSEAVAAVQQALAALQPGETIDARLPIAISVRKCDEAGAYVSAFGGLAPYWAQFTDRVRGYYQIDSHALHHLPDDEATIRALIDRIVAATEGMQLGELRTVEAEDFWRVQRLRSGRGLAVLGLPPGDEMEQGAPLRRRVRQALNEAGQRLRQREETARALLLVGHYASVQNEPVGTALRGLDPALFAGIDLVALAADATIKPLLDITRRIARRGAPA